TTSTSTIPPHVYIINDKKDKYKLYNLRQLNNKEFLLKHQKQDVNCNIIFKCAMVRRSIRPRIAANLPPQLKYFWKNKLIFIKDNIIIIKIKGQDAIYVPKTLRLSYINYWHDKWHNSPKQILDRLHKDYLYWEGMFKDIKTFTKECQVCIRRNNYRKPKEAKIQFFPTNKFGEIISVDYMGPLPTTSKNNK